MAKLATMAKSLRKKEAGREAFESFFSELTDLYYQIHILNLSMEYYSTLKKRQEEGFSDEAEEDLKEITNFMETVFFQEEREGREKGKDRISKKRAQLIERMEVLSAYDSCLWNLQYALLRRDAESERKWPTDLDEEAREILRFLFEGNDNMLMNLKIKEVLKHLPIRYTRGKFFELLSNALDCYKGQERAGFDDFVYGARHAAMRVPEMPKFPFYEDLKKRFQTFMTMDFSKLSKEEIKQAKKEVQAFKGDGEKRAEEIYFLVDVVNALYGILLVGNAKESENAKWAVKLLSLLKEAYKDDSLWCPEYEEEILAIFAKLEGKIEVLYDEISLFDEGLYFDEELQEKLSSLGLKDCFEGTMKSSLLLKSAFLDFDKLKTRKKTVSREEIDSTKFDMEKEIAEVFKEVRPLLRRAVMAQILGAIPVFFENRSEVMEYVRTSLSSCDNEEEVKAALDCIDDFRRENGYCQ